MGMQNHSHFFVESEVMIVFNMSRYNEKEADSLDKLIRSALIIAAERIIIPTKQNRILLSKIKSQSKNSKNQNSNGGDVNGQGQSKTGSTCHQASKW